MRAAPESFENAQLPPHNIEAEQGVVGCCLLDTRDALGLAIERIAASEVFFDLRHQAIYEAMRQMVDAGKFVDAITLGEQLRSMPATVGGSETTNVLEALGGMPYLAGLMNLVPSAASLEYYLEIVLEKFRLRRMVRTLAECQAKIWTHEGTVTELLNGIESAVLEAGEDATRTGIRSQLDVVKRTADLIERHFHRGRGIIEGVATGFSYLDKMLGGLHNGELGVIGARPSVGKTALMMNIVKHVVKVQKRRVGIFSLEMQDTALCMRLWCDIAGVNMQELRTGYATDRDMHRLGTYMPEMAKLGIDWDDTAALDIQTFRARARRMKRMGCQLIVLDYMQLMTNPDLEGDARHLEVASISRALCATKKELNIPIVALAQLNRESEKKRNLKPTMADLGESGQIERDADWIGLLYRPQEKDGEESGDENVVPVNLLIAKQRNGPTGDCEFLFNKKFMRFEDRYGGKGAKDGEAGARERVAAVPEKVVDFEKLNREAAQKPKPSQGELPSDGNGQAWPD